MHFDQQNGKITVTDILKWIMAEISAAVKTWNYLAKFRVKRGNNYFKRGFKHESGNGKIVYTGKIVFTEI